MCAPRGDRDGAIPRRIGALRRAEACVRYAEAPAKNDNGRGHATSRLSQFPIHAKLGRRGCSRCLPRRSIVPAAAHRSHFPLQALIGDQIHEFE